MFKLYILMKYKEIYIIYSNYKKQYLYNKGGVINNNTNPLINRVPNNTSDLIESIQKIKKSIIEFKNSFFLIKKEIKDFYNDWKFEDFHFFYTRLKKFEDLKKNLDIYNTNKDIIIQQLNNNSSIMIQNGQSIITLNNKELIDSLINNNYTQILENIKDLNINNKEYSTYLLCNEEDYDTYVFYILLIMITCYCNINFNEDHIEHINFQKTKVEIENHLDEIKKKYTKFENISLTKIESFRYINININDIFVYWYEKEFIEKEEKEKTKEKKIEEIKKK